MAKSLGRRLPPEERREQLLVLSLGIAEEIGYRQLTSSAVAAAAGLQSHGLIFHYFGTTEGLRREVIRRAIEVGNLEVVLQGIVTKDPLLQDVPEGLRSRALLKLACE